MLLEMAAEGAPDRVVVGDRSDGLTSASLLDLSRRAARRLQQSGAEHAAYFGLNSDALPVALFAAAYARLPFVPVNYRATDEQLAEIFARVAPALVVCDEGDRGRLNRLGVSHTLSTLELVEAAGRPSQPSEPDWLEPGDPDDIAVLLFTSGTTGPPKAAVLRHRHLTSYVISTVEFMGWDESESQLVSVPPYHVAGVATVLSSLYGGRRIVYLAGFDADAWVELVRANGITQAMVVPTMLGRILDSIDRTGADLESLRHLSYGGGRMPVGLVERALLRLPRVDFVNAYGLTETSSTISILTPEDHRQALASADKSVRGRLGSVGRPLGTLEVEIRGADEKALPAGQAGEVWVRGEQVAGEYAGGTVLTPDGWFRTRDSGRLDSAGYLYLEGRLDDVIVRGAENISPGEIEDVLVSHPAVAEAAVVGVPDPEWGEAVAAAVVLEEAGTVSVSELQDFVRQRLRSTRTPSLVEFRQALPYNETGKLLRRLLRDELAATAKTDEETR
ncbi:MAG TPA: class I adenylate-forming enzyme family protein [Acidimicrobiales bacterium]|jgi:acyl-CoA synthetase (AMP-forming)/AMP-acid ligase II|nr:class I adenylate-forming enzyme family protein [Acidimicrobiales bacterium]